jgi:hypothetical protein
MEINVIFKTHFFFSVNQCYICIVSRDAGAVRLDVFSGEHTFSFLVFFFFFF